MSILDRMSNTYAVESAFLKLGAFGDAGSGKSTTGALAMLALHRHLKVRNIPGHELPVAILDSEGGSDYIKWRFEQEGVPLLVLKTRSSADLFAALKELPGQVLGLMIDSATHFWAEFVDSYKEAKKRRFLQIDDWGYLKPKWAQEYTIPFLNAPMHIAMLGRAGFEFEDTTDAEGKRQLNKVGVKMKSESESAYEPSLLLYLETEQGTVKREKAKGVYTDDPAIINHIHVFKDRFSVIHGKHWSFQPDPDEALDEQIVRVWKMIAPHVMRLNLGGKQGKISTESSASLHPGVGGKPAWTYENEKRDIAIEKLKTLFDIELGKSGEGKKRVIELIRVHAGTESMTEIETMTLDRVEAIYEAIHKELRGCGSADFIKAAQEKAGVNPEKGSDDEEGKQGVSGGEAEGPGQGTSQGTSQSQQTNGELFGGEGERRVA